MFTRTLTALALVLSGALPAFAEDEGTVDAAVQETLTAQLVAQGYEVRQFKAEAGLIEVYVVKDGETAELFFDQNLQQVEHDEGDEG